MDGPERVRSVVRMVWRFGDGDISTPDGPKWTAQREGGGRGVEWIGTLDT